MTEHVEIGQAILLAAELPLEAHWVFHHHERVDGGGYPSGLEGAAIPSSRGSSRSQTRSRR